METRTPDSIPSGLPGKTLARKHPRYVVKDQVQLRSVAIKPGSALVTGYGDFAFGREFSLARVEEIHFTKGLIHVADVSPANKNLPSEELGGYRRYKHAF